MGHRAHALTLGHLLAAVGVVAPHVQQAGDEINIPPAQRQQLTLT
jgi:hypothetical protein